MHNNHFHLIWDWMMIWWMSEIRTSKIWKCLKIWTDARKPDASFINNYLCVIKWARLVLSIRFLYNQASGFQAVSEIRTLRKSEATYLSAFWTSPDFRHPLYITNLTNTKADITQYCIWVLETFLGRQQNRDNSTKSSADWLISLSSLQNSSLSSYSNIGK